MLDARKMSFEMFAITKDHVFKAAVTIRSFR